MKLIKENYLFLILISLLFLINRYSKIQILNLLEDKNYLFINNFLNLNLVFNTGIGFGLFSLEAGIIYNLLSTFILFIILVLLFFCLGQRQMKKYFFHL